jgi:protein phosphatase
MALVEHAGLSEQGPVRPNNEDFISHAEPAEDDDKTRRGWLFAVCDGVGGSDGGEIASREAARTLIEKYYSSIKPPARALRDAYAGCNMRVYDLGTSQRSARRMQTTMSALVLTANQMYVGHVGDTRVYRVRGKKIDLLTRDHSEVGELMRIGLLTAEEARHHPRRSIITRSLGQEMMVQADVTNEPFEEGDIFVLCTDGVWEPVEDEEIAATVGFHTPAEACQRLVDLAIERGSEDNCSIQIVKVLKCGAPMEQPERGGKGVLRWLLGTTKRRTD